MSFWVITPLIFHQVDSVTYDTDRLSCGDQSYVDVNKAQLNISIRQAIGLQSSEIRCVNWIVNFVWRLWCPEPDSNRHSAFAPRDFKSLVSTYSTIRA